MNKQQLASKIWESANRMRSKIEANEYKDYILGFIFYKYLSEREEHWLHEQGYDDASIAEYINESDKDDEEGTFHSVQNGLGYFISYEDLFSTWIKKGSDFSIDNVRTALSSFSRLILDSQKEVFGGIFDTLGAGLSKLGENTKSQTKAASDLIHLIDEIPMHGKQDYDMLGFIYEYLIGNFAANAGKKAGEFYTPHEVSLLMSELVANHLRGRNEIKIYDPTSGSGSLLINIGKTMAKYMEDANRIRYYAQELKVNTYNLTRMNLIMRGILPDNIVTRNADTLENDWPLDAQNSYGPLYVDAVVSNPPYSQRWDPAGHETDARYARYGLAPKSKADYAFLLHDLYHLKPDGIMTIVLPHGVLFRGGEEGQIRRNLIEYNNIDAIIGLPANIFYGTGIPTIIMVLRQKRENTDVLIVDASKGFAKEGKNNKLRPSDIRRIVDVVRERKTVDKFSRVVSQAEIAQNDYNLNIPRYVDSSEPAESYDLYATMFGGIPVRELNTLSKYWQVFPSLKAALFQGDGEYVSLQVKDCKAAIQQNSDVQNFVQHFHQAFADFGNSMDNALIAQAATLSIAKTEDAITADIFRRFADVPLLDPYQAYESFANQYGEITGDLELIQAEGMEAVRKVDPNLVTKKKGGKDVEVQEGWKGHILPFDLVQRVCLHDDLQALQEKQDELTAIPGEYDELLDAMSEEDKENAADALNDNNDAFVIKNIKSVVKELKENEAENHDLIQTLNKAVALNSREKKLKSEIKNDSIALEKATIEKIQNLSDEEVKQLLHEKWAVPVVNGILSLSDSLLDTFTKKIKALAEKYAETMSDIEKEIRETEHSLADMLSELTGPEADMKGIAEFQKLLRGEDDE